MIKIYSIKIFKREGDFIALENINEKDSNEIMREINKLELYDTLMIEKVKGDEFKTKYRNEVN